MTPVCSSTGPSPRKRMRSPLGRLLCMTPRNSTPNSSIFVPVNTVLPTPFIPGRISSIGIVGGAASARAQMGAKAARAGTSPMRNGVPHRRRRRPAPRSRGVAVLMCIGPLMVSGFPAGGPARRVLRWSIRRGYPTVGCGEAGFQGFPCRFLPRVDRGERDPAGSGGVWTPGSGRKKPVRRRSGPIRRYGTGGRRLPARR